MTILHICSDFFYTDLYINLISAINSNSDINQIIYVPQKKGRKAESLERLTSKVATLKGVTIVYSIILEKWHRVFYFAKINTILEDIESRVDLSEIDLIHTHFLFSDGGVAYKIGKKYNVPFMTAIRNTDINVFYKYFIHCRPYARKVLNASKSIIFVSPAYTSLLEKRFFKRNVNKLKEKSIVIPNGIDDFWLKANDRERTFRADGVIRFVYVGELSKNKNIHNTIAFLKDFKTNSSQKLEFNIIGKRSDYTEPVLDLVEQNEWVNYLGPIYDKTKLRAELNRADIFVMLSKKETFGLVYVEAMSQGLPILYTRGQGIDGFFPDGTVGFSFDINNLCAEKEKIGDIFKDYQKMSSNAKTLSQSFNWKEISKKYIEVYNG